MKRQPTFLGLLLGTLLVALSGCASYPISKNAHKQAKPLTLTQVSANPSAYTGTTVIWGGQILRTINNPEGATLYVVKLPLDGGEMPRRHEYSSGRFIVRSRGFIDPDLYQQGRLVTIAGKIAGVESEPLQNIQYSYPVLNLQEIYLWYGSAPSAPYPYPAGWGPGWDWEYYDQGWYGPDWGLRNRRWNWE